MTGLVEIWRAKHLPHAHVIKARLASEGIPVFIAGEHLQDLGDGPLRWDSMPRVLVREQDAQRALQIIARIEEGPGGPAGTSGGPDDRAGGR